MSYTTLFFDLDDTLYPSEAGLWEAIRVRINRYMCERMRIPPDEASALRRHYYETYGTTLRGLQIHYQIDPDDFLAYVHDLPLNAYLQPDPALRALLLALPQPKWIFTNADVAHAGRVLAGLGLEGCFQGIIDVRARGFVCKPQPEAYPQALRLAGESEPGRCVFFDDAPRNLAPARALGIYTVLVGTALSDPSACLSVRRLHDLPGLLPGVFPAARSSL
jgi:putative hydrolase of the HAD superfamily